MKRGKEGIYHPLRLRKRREWGRPFGQAQGRGNGVAAFSFGSTRAKNSATPFPEEEGQSRSISRIFLHQGGSRIFRMADSPAVKFATHFFSLPQPSSSSVVNLYDCDWRDTSLLEKRRGVV